MDLVEAKARGFATAARHPWERARLDLAARLIARHVDLKPGDTVLDVGCGDTFVAESLARRYPRVQFYAVDSAFSDEVMASCRERLTVSNVALFASLDHVPAGRSASLVLLMDVIEHVPDDRAFLRSVCDHPLIDANTRMLITVPSYAWLFSAHDRFLGHYRRYSTRSLNALLRDARLGLVEAGHLFTSLLAVRVFQVVAERVWHPRHDRSTHVADWNGSEQTARALTRLLTLDGRVALMLSSVGLRLPGLSNFAVCRKSA